MKENRMKIKGLEHVAIAVTDLEAMMALFRDKLGLTLAGTEEFAESGARVAMYPVGNSQLELVHSPKPDSMVSRWIACRGQGLFHLCLEVEDLDGAMAELRAKGMHFLADRPRTGHAGSRIAFIDPECAQGLLIELAELPPTPGLKAPPSRTTAGR